MYFAKKKRVKKMKEKRIYTLFKHIILDFVLSVTLPQRRKVVLLFFDVSFTFQLELLLVEFSPL